MNKNAKAFFIAPVGNNNSLSLASIALVHSLEKAGYKVGYLKPVSFKNKDSSGSLLNSLASLPVENLESAILSGDMSEFLEDLVALYQSLVEGNDVIVVEGLPFNASSAIDFQSVNAHMARGLAADYILVASACQDDMTDEHWTKSLELSRAQFENFGQERVVAAIVTGCKDSDLSCSCSDKIKIPLLGKLPSISNQSLSDEVISQAVQSLGVTTLSSLIKETVEARMTPPMFRQMLIKAARAANKRIVLPEGDEPRTIRAATICHEKKIAHCVLVGDPKKIKAVAQTEGIELPSDITIIDLEKVRSQYIEPMVELRKSKGMTPEQASKELEDSVVLGTMMLAVGDVDGLVSGAVHTTASTVRPALQLIKTAPGNSIVSSVFFMLMPDQVVAYADCAINPNPTAPQLAEIAWQTSDSAKSFGINPRVAMISYSTGTSGTGPDVDLVREATSIVKEKRPDIEVEGPIQFDAATVPSVGKQKAPDSKVAGIANVLVFPDLNTGNTTYKAVQRSANLVSVGPMLQGLRKPVNDLSRGALVEDIVFTIALTAIQAGT